MGTGAFLEHGTEVDLVRAEMAIPSEVVRLQCHPASGCARFQLVLANEERASARAVILATGAQVVAALHAFLARAGEAPAVLPDAERA